MNTKGNIQATIIILLVIFIVFVLLVLLDVV